MRKMNIAIVGLGSIGTTLVRKLGLGEIPGANLVAVSVRNEDKGRAVLAKAGVNVPIVEISELAEVADLIIECAPAAILPEIATPVLKAGKKIMVVSCGALLAHPELIDLAHEHGGQIIIPTGALIGLDAVSAAAEGEIKSVRMITRKPVRGLLGAPYLVENGIEIEGITEPMRVFEGTARDAAKGFPANLNVAVALSLAGIGPDATRLEIWADPSVTRNTHKIVVDSDSASFEMSIENIPSENPKTGRITALSVIAAIRKLTAPLRVGT
ncbi:MAG: aspartate dehydrogenase [Alphaproteobacteria bacterium]|nr:aspartate dehydrogenase [Alphaproteobacteria bacterium]